MTSPPPSTALETPVVRRISSGMTVSAAPPRTIGTSVRERMACITESSPGR